MTVLRRIAVAVLASIGLLAMSAGAAAASPQVSAQDRTFLMAAHQGNLAEIQAGRAAQSKAQTSTVRSIGAMFVADHSRLDASLKKAAAALGVSLPSQPNAQQQAALTQINSHSGIAWDRSFLVAQIPAHAMTLAAGKKEMAQGSAPQAIGVARTSGPVVQKHLNELNFAAVSLGAVAPSTVNTGTGGQAASMPERTQVFALLLAIAGLLAVGTGVKVGLVRRRH